MLLPTYNERENLPLMVALLVKAFEETVREEGPIRWRGRGASLHPGCTSFSFSGFHVGPHPWVTLLAPLLVPLQLGF